MDYFQFYTKENVAKECVELVKNLKSFDFIIEPSAGTGNFLKYLPQNTIAYDIDPKYPGIILQDYLTLTPNFNGKVLVIGNPPFGKNSCLAKQFIKKSCEFAHTVAFILPRSFKKESMYKVFPLNFSLEFQKDLDFDSFIFNEKSYSIPCVFQIWEKSEILRQIKSKVSPNLKFYSFVDFSLIAFKRVGGKAGNFEFENPNASKQSHYFLLFNSNSVDLAKFKEHKFIFETNNTTGPKSISKQELIEKLNEYFEKI
jgi:hypothetical protein